MQPNQPATRFLKQKDWGISNLSCSPPFLFIRGETIERERPETDSMLLSDAGITNIELRWDENKRVLNFAAIVLEKLDVTLVIMDKERKIAYIAVLELYPILTFRKVTSHFSCPNLTLKDDHQVLVYHTKNWSIIYRAFLSKKN